MKNFLPNLLALLLLISAGCTEAFDPWSHLKTVDHFTGQSGSPKDVYMVIANTTGNTVDLPAITDTLPPASRSLDSPSSLGPDNNDHGTAQPSSRILDLDPWAGFTPQKTASSRVVNSRSTPAPSADFVGKSVDFYAVEGDLVTISSHAAVVREMRDVSTQFGTKRLTVAVDTRATLTDQQVTAMADLFLKSGTDNDVFDWVTQITGEENGPYVQLRDGWSADPAYLSEDDAITILLKPLDKFKADGTPEDFQVYGYVQGLNSFYRTAHPGYAQSNERRMFIINSDRWVTPDSGQAWSPTGSYPKAIASTLAHEFQHLIEIYQRYYLRGYIDGTWQNEMMSMMIQDLLAEKMDNQGLMGRDAAGTTGTAARYQDLTASSELVSFGRMVDFATQPTSWFFRWPSSQTKSILDNYANHAVLGAYLNRNYGGPAMVKELMESLLSGEAAVLAAMQNRGFSGTSPGDILLDLGQAIVASDMVREPAAGPTFNRGGWFTNTVNLTSGTTDYRLISYNFYTQTAPFAWSIAGLKNYQAGGNKLNPWGLTWVRLGQHVDVDFDVKAWLPSGVKVLMVPIDMVNPNNTVLQ